MRPIWPSLQRLDQSPGIPQRHNNQDIAINTSGCFESPNSNNTNSISGEESSDGYKSSEQEDGDFEDSEREDSLNDWTYDMDNRNVPDVSSFCRDSGHRSMDRMTVNSAKEFLELLFELSLSITMENFVDGQPGSALLVYFSGILGFSSDC
ncbi:Linoleate 10R-lipoxygenase [Fusarium oxysporum f. sp. albedinis]|nr:Linoleate 10R-lipoxygenase [Fusarium oxysporum f. sp. albedinis]